MSRLCGRPGVACGCMCLVISDPGIGRPIHHASATQPPPIAVHLRLPLSRDVAPAPAAHQPAAGEEGARSPLPYACVLALLPGVTPGLLGHRGCSLAQWFNQENFTQLFLIAGVLRLPHQAGGSQDVLNACKQQRLAGLPLAEQAAAAAAGRRLAKGSGWSAA